MDADHSLPDASKFAPVATELPRHWRAWIGQSAIALAVIGLLAYGIVRYRARSALPTVRYETAAVDVGPLDAKVTATGALSPLITVQVGSQVSGRIATLLADFGSTVRRGQIIATIDPALFRAAAAQGQANLASARAGLERARAQRVLAERQFARNTALLAQGLVTRAEYDLTESNAGVAAAEIATGQAAVAQARAALDQAELSLKYTTITSPIDGIVISRNVDVGQTVAAALQAPTLFTIAQDLTRMQVDANVAEADVGKVQAGMHVAFAVDAYPGRFFDGSVRQVRDNAQTLQNVVTYDVVIDVANPDRMLKPGMTANVALSYATRDHALRVPQAGLRFKPDSAALVEMLGSADAARFVAPSAAGHTRVVWVLRGTTPAPIAAQIGVNDGSFAEVTSGDIHVGDRVIVEVVKRAP
ncbi:MAG TPA: efflux RND transporter periplasmic adaptor subunit [Polyangiaceae bacterium]